MAEGLEPMWENLSVIQSRWPDNRLDLYLLKETLWNVLMALDYAWDLSPGHSLFSGQDPERKSYLTRVHLAEVIGLLKPPPADLIKRGKRSLE
ncbi:hypothetical protein PENSUB_11740 [Penicillium subrubescens]|uniref:Uncharacterized protein n=1 Tax=Penicillium subrubescens TaxID=1316194 RepID=A0A1Q5T2M2_9EURO|nr:hypothetical protein PENSUB_11740 [Penicillium subrubescens]